jgi:hypothetical protein
MPRSNFDDDDETPRPRRRRGPDRDDEPESRRPRRTPRDDDEDDRPRRKPAGKKKSSNLPIILGVLAIVGLLLLSACGLGLYYLASPTDSPKMGTTGPGPGGGGAGANTMPIVTLPPGWVEFNDPSNELRLYWPKGQPTRAAGGVNIETWTQEYKGRTYILIRSALPAADSGPDAEAMTLENAVARMLSDRPGATEVRKNTETEGGRKVRVSTIDIPRDRQRVFVQMTIGHGKLIILTITAPMNNDYWATGPDMAPFFQSLWVK